MYELMAFPIRFQKETRKNKATWYNLDILYNNDKLSERVLLTCWGMSNGVNCRGILSYFLRSLTTKIRFNPIFDFISVQIKTDKKHEKSDKSYSTPQITTDKS